VPKTTWTEPLVLDLIAASGRADPREAIEDYAESLLEAAMQRSLPIRVDLIASLKGIRSREGRFDFAGRIYAEEDGQLVMDLNSADAEPRRRFTTAHELMHTAFPCFTEEKRYRLDTTVETNPINREEEYLCDLGAAALLMPAHLVDGNYSIADEGLRAIERLSRIAEVSLQAAGNRLAELSDSRAAFMVFEFGHKPADRPALRRGEKVPRRARLRYAHCAHLDVYLPRFKGAASDSPISRAFASGRRERGVEALPGSKDGRPFAIEAKAFGSDERRVVLAVATPV
jgi:Zn-dependent peptidase ImmA (M78 family)